MLKEIDQMEAQITITDGAVRLVGTVGTVGMAALLQGMVVVALLVGTTEVEGEGAQRREALGVLQPLDVLIPRQGQIEPLLAQVQDEVPTAMMVCLSCGDRFFSTAHLMQCFISSIRTLGCCFATTAAAAAITTFRYGPRAWLNISCAADGTTIGTNRWPQHISAAN
jgi:hypothetical protein